MESRYETCPIEPWCAEIATRMHEAHASGSTVLSLGPAHPRGFIPNQILRRPAVKELIGTWTVDVDSGIVAAYPNYIWAPPGIIDFGTCDLVPFEQEIEVRVYEAEVEAYNKSVATGLKHVPVVDLTNNHPRGGIPDMVMRRLDRRRNKKWRQEAEAEISRLEGEANQAEAFAKTQDERARGLEDSQRDPTNLRASAQELRERAELLRAQARGYRKEMGLAESIAA